VVVSTPKSTTDDLIDRAERSLYRAKIGGRRSHRRFRVILGRRRLLPATEDFVDVHFPGHRGGRPGYVTVCGRTRFAGAEERVERSYVVAGGFVPTKRKFVSG